MMSQSFIRWGWFEFTFYGWGTWFFGVELGLRRGDVDFEICFGPFEFSIWNRDR